MGTLHDMRNAKRTDKSGVVSLEQYSAACVFRFVTHMTNVFPYVSYIELNVNASGTSASIHFSNFFPESKTKFFSWELSQLFDQEMSGLSIGAKCRGSYSKERYNKCGTSTSFVMFGRHGHFR